MRIGSRQVGRGQPPYIIAEIGVNHDGDPEQAIVLVDVAAKCGADAVKFQLFEARRLMSATSSLASYQARAGESDPVEMLRRLELSVEQLAPVVARAHARGICAIVTVFSEELVQSADRLAWDAYKTASPDVINKPILEALARTSRPLIVSTGAATLEEVGRAVDWLRTRWDRLALLHCVSCYPTPPEYASLPAMADLAGLFDGPIGYSDHTDQIDTGALAVRIGASILEKHITYNRTAQGPDHAMSLAPDQFEEYVRLARNAFGDRSRIDTTDPRLVIRRKAVLEVEEDVRRVSRQSVVANRDIRKGERLRRADLTLKRPGDGLPPYKLEDLVGGVAARDIPANRPLYEEDIENAVLWSAGVM
jgi:N-acetylneuraminate synthase/N,N'-diacetyllegionaminate synthase